jgi:hypothetical protein
MRPCSLCSTTGSRAVQEHNIGLPERVLLRSTDDKGVDVLVVTDRFIHE